VERTSSLDRSSFSALNWAIFASRRLDGSDMVSGPAYVLRASLGITSYESSSERNELKCV
jgi:hypothetical protein